MFAPSIVPFVLDLSGQQSNVSPLLLSGSSFSFEIRTKFPLSTDLVLQPSIVSASIVTIGNGTLDSTYLSLWYAKNSVSSETGSIYLTSSAGLLSIGQLPIFDGNFYNLSVIKDLVTGTLGLFINRYEDDALVFQTSSLTTSFNDATVSKIEIGSSTASPSQGEFWAQEFRFWSASLDQNEVLAHAAHFESYGRDRSHRNKDLLVHWRMDDGVSADGGGNFYLTDSTLNCFTATGSNFTPGGLPFTKFLLDYAYIPSIDYGWNQKKVRTYTGSIIQPQDRYEDERFVSLEFNLFDALNENISHLISDYEELGDFIGNPINRYRDEYPGIGQMRETYFKRLQGQLSFRTFVDMMDFFDTSFVSVVQGLLPARAAFNGAELVVESHMLERPKFQYQLRPIIEGTLTITGSISVVDRGYDDIWG